MRHIRAEELPAAADLRRALARFCREARRSAGARVRSIVVYGSAARGDAGPDSDLDLWVDWDGAEAEGRSLLMDVADRIFAGDGVLVSVHIVSPEHKERLASWGNAFYRNVQADGLIVDA